VARGTGGAGRPRDPRDGASAVGGVPSGAGGDPAITRTAIFSYLKIHGLSQYARAFVEAGLSDIEAVARLTEGGALELLERLRVYPGHRLRLLRAVDSLRNAALSTEVQDAAQLLEERLHAENKELSQEKEEKAVENERLRADNERLLAEVRQQDAKLQKSRDRIAELEELVQTQTEQVTFLTQQLQRIAEQDPKREAELYRSYRDSLADLDDWSSATKIQLPNALPVGETTVDHRHLLAADSGELSTSKNGATATFGPLSPEVSESPRPPPSRGAPPRPPVASPSSVPESTQFMQPGRARLAQSLDSAQVRECLAGFDVDHIVQCLATAIQNKIILSVGKRRPHTATHQRLSACAIFLEPNVRKKLTQPQSTPDKGLPTAGSDLGSALSFCSALMSKASPGSNSLSLGESLSRPPPDPLNDIVNRSAPSKWDIYGFLRDVMINFRLQPEVSIVTLFYLDRFTESSGVALTPDNWQRLTIAAMMLASKVWDDESFENVEFAQLCPLYTLDEINTFERVFLQSVGYVMSVKGSEYAKTYFHLRTIGAKDSSEFIAPLDPVRASRLTERCLEKQVEFRERYMNDPGNDAMNWTL